MGLYVPLLEFNHNCIMGPVGLTPEKESYSVLILQIFQKGVIKPGSRPVGECVVSEALRSGPSPFSW